MKRKRKITREEFVDSLYKIIEDVLNSDIHLDMKYFDTLKLLLSSDNINITNMLNYILTNEIRTVYAIDETDKDCKSRFISFYIQKRQSTQIYY